MGDYEKASVKIATSLAYLNSGQNVVFSTALGLMMFLAARGVVDGVSPASVYGPWPSPSVQAP
jgi:ABC transporter ATM